MREASLMEERARDGFALVGAGAEATTGKPEAVEIAMVASSIMGTHASALSASSESDWVQAHAALSRLSRQRAALDVEEGRWLLCAWRSAAHLHLGYASFAQYVERLFGYKARTTQEKLRVAEALEALPRLASALESGGVSWCAARELTRVARPDTESAWLDAARGKTLRELEVLVASKAPGDAPDAPAIEPPRPRVLRFEVAADTFAIFREAMLRLRRSAGSRLDDDAVLLAMARHVLGGPRDEGRSSYQLSLSVCAACGSGALPAAGELVQVDAAVVAMAGCDAQHLDERLPSAAAPQPANENATPIAQDTSMSPAAGNGGRAHDDIPAELSGARSHTAFSQSLNHAHVDARSERKKHARSGLEKEAASDPSSAGSDVSPASDTRFAATDVSPASDTRSDVSPASAPSSSVATHESPPKGATAPHIRPRARAKQSIPPALRRAVIARDQRRCRVPGCSHATFIDVHHLQPRSEGGRHEASNLLTLCGAHHRAAHRGELLIERDPDGSFAFRHADGTPYGHPMAPRLIDAHAKVFSALRHLGFREGEVKAVLGELHGDPELGDASVERLLREALRRIRPKAR